MNKSEKDREIKKLLASQDFTKYLHQKKSYSPSLTSFSALTKKKFYKPKSKEELKELVKNPNISLANILTDEIFDMSWLFHNADRDFSGIEKWNVSRVEDMNSMFAGAINFNSDIGKWQVGRVRNMSFMFKDCKNFNQNLENWNVSSVRKMNWMFANCLKFNQNLKNWDVSKVKDMSNMFDSCVNFNQDISAWQVDNVEDFSWMFKNCLSFNQNLSSWQVIKSDNIENIFKNCLRLEKKYIYYFLQKINENSKALLVKDERGNYKAKSQKELNFMLKIGLPLEEIDQSSLENFRFAMKNYETEDFKIHELSFGKKLIIAEMKNSPKIKPTLLAEKVNKK